MNNHNLPKYCNDEIPLFWWIYPNCCTCRMEVAHTGVFRSRKYLPPSCMKSTLGCLHRQTHIRRCLQLGMNWCCWLLSKKTFLLPSSSTTCLLRNLDWNLGKKRLMKILETTIDLALLNAIAITNYEIIAENKLWSTLRSMKTTEKANQ